MEADPKSPSSHPEAAGGPHPSTHESTADAAPPFAARKAVSTLFFLNGALFATWVSRLPAMETARGLSHAQLGLALLVIAAGAVISMPLAGVLGSRIGTAAICRATVLTYCVILPLLAVIPGVPLWALALLIFGMSHGALDVAMNAQAVEVEKRYPHPVMSVFHALFSTGGLAGAAVGGVLAFWLRPEAHFLVISAVMAGIGFAAFPHLIPKTAPVFPTAALRAMVPQRRRGLRLPSGRLAALGMVALCVMMGEGAMADWTAVYLRRVIGTSEGVAATGYAAFSIAMAAGRFSGDKLSGTFGAVNLVRGSGLLAVAGMVLALFVTHPAAAMTGFALVGAGFATMVPMVFSAAGRTPGMAPEVALASVSTFGYLGFLLGPPAIGFAADVIGLRGALGLVALASLTASLLAGAVRHGDGT